MYQQLLLDLPSLPEVETAASGPGALALLEAGSFTLFISDLRMSRMDGLQVLAVVRRRFPNLRTMAFTGHADEHVRSRAYAIGVDFFFEKPSNEKELDYFLECVESLLSREPSGGFRGVQSKNLVDIIQLECLSGSSSVLRITNGKLEGKVWIHQGELVDASTGEQSGEDAFRTIMGWRTGGFEIMPGESERPRTIRVSAQGLLLDSVQAVDEAAAISGGLLSTEEVAETGSEDGLGRIRGLEFALSIRLETPEVLRQWSLPDPQKGAEWASQTAHALEALGEKLQFGAVRSITVSDAQRHVRVMATANSRIVGGFNGSLSPAEIDRSMTTLIERWDS